MKIFGNHKHLIAALAMSACLTVFLGACNASGQSIPTTTTSSLPNVPIQNIPGQLNADLVHSPVGTVDLNWDAESHNLKVKVSARGLAPNSTHPEHIHAGTCASNPMGAIVYSLNPLVADAHGVGTSETTIAKVEHGIAEKGWYVNIHNGPTLNTAEEANPIACANIEKKGEDGSQVHVTLSGTMAPDQSAHGQTQLRIEGNKIIVKMTISGLAPKSAHIAHIHAGSCASQGPVVYPLALVTADAKGNATVSTTITVANIKNFISAQLYINVHEAGTMSGMSKQQGFDPIACGDISYHA